MPQEEFNELVEGIREKGGFVSEKQNPDGSLSPYELNVTYFDAFSDPNGSKSLQERRFVCSQIIAMSLRGVPGIYFHNLTATRNNQRGVSVTGRYRSINRKKWYYDELMKELRDPDTQTSRIFGRLKDIIAKRWHHEAFHPLGGQKVHALGKEWFCVERWDPDRLERILVLANVTGQEQSLSLNRMRFLSGSKKSYNDVLSGKDCVKDGIVKLSAYQVVWITL